MKQRVVIAGMGLTTQLGVGVQANWNSLGTFLTLSRNLPQMGPAGKLLDREERPQGVEGAKDLAEQACREAFRDAGLETVAASERMGCTVSASKPLFQDDQPQPPERINEFVRQKFGLYGESRNVIAACATGIYSTAIAASWIEQGICDVVLAGAVEPQPHPLIRAGFEQMGVTSSDGVTRPFDKRRSGFTFGYGAGILVLESEQHARARGARTHAVLSGRALGADAHSAFAFNSGGGKISAVIDQAIQAAGLTKEDILHVNAHGTATRHNDWIETQALLKTFGSHAEKLMISATKASTGHLLGASGAVELIFTTLALTQQFIPPTATLEEQDPECPLDYTPRKGHASTFDHALSLSFGFGGPIGAIVLSRV